MKYLAVLALLVFIAGSLIVLNTIYLFLPRVANITTAAGQAIVDNWHGFLLGEKDSEAIPAEKLDPDQELALKIKTEVDRAIDARLNEAGNAEYADRPSAGLMVLPNDRSSSTVIADIANSVSDQVIVTAEADGRSGVITPIFKDGPGPTSFWFLVPINNQ